MTWLDRYRAKKRAMDINPEAPQALAIAQATRNKVHAIAHGIIDADHEDRLLKTASVLKGMDSLVHSIKGMTDIMERDGDKLLDGRR